MITFEERKQQIKSELKKVYENVIDAEQSDKIQEGIDRLYDEDSTPEAKELEKQISSSIITVYTLVEFMFLMSQVTKIPEIISGIIEHENAHANVAESHGRKFVGYKLHISAKGERRFLEPWAEYGLPTGWRKIPQLVQQVIDITSAPATYGHRLSKGDERRLERLKQYL